MSYYDLFVLRRSLSAVNKEDRLSFAVIRPQRDRYEPLAKELLYIQLKALSVSPQKVSTRRGSRCCLRGVFSPDCVRL